MSNIFMSESHNHFAWEKLGNIHEGRQNLGETMPVWVYRLLEYTINDVLHETYGDEQANELFRKAGYKAGRAFAEHVLNTQLPLSDFLAALHLQLIDSKIGILRLESFDEQTGEFIVTVAEDLDCSGLPPTNEVVCNYDEGFLQGIMEVYTGKAYSVREIDCWASGERVCRFKGVNLSAQGA